MKTDMNVQELYESSKLLNLKIMPINETKNFDKN